MLQGNIDSQANLVKGFYDEPSPFNDANRICISKIPPLSIN